MEVQTRSEETGLASHDSLDAAFYAAKLDPTIWKISFNAEDGSRIRLVKHDDDMWIYEPLLS